jgi:hypothetical protein
MRPYVQAGYAPRHISGTITSQGWNVDFATGLQQPYSYSLPWTPDMSHGIVTGGGIEFVRGRLRVAPELRYTRWNNDPIDAHVTYDYQVNAARNQFEVLVGITLR